MLKKLLQGAVIGTAMLGLVGSAAAVNYEINVYGASAQYLYWNDAADNFLTNVKGCDTVTQGQNDGKNNGITYGINCPGPGGDTYTIRYSSKASFDGVLSVKGDDSQTGAAEICHDGDPIAPPTGGTIAAGQAGYYRKMASSVGAPNTLMCARVNIGASDVAGESFSQESHGCLKGYKTAGAPFCEGDNWVDRVFSPIPTGTLDKDNTVIVPFGFFANNCVTKTKCLSPNPIEGNPPLAGEPTATAPAESSDWGNDKAISAWGNQCWDPDGDGHSRDCIGYWKCVDSKCVGGTNKDGACAKLEDCPDVDISNTVCKRIPIDNLSRMMAVMIFSGQVDDWQDFGAWWDGDCDPTAADTTRDPIVACLRHAGSGTHATLDLAVMKGNGWGGDVAIDQYDSSFVNDKYSYGVWFNDGSSDEMKCINERMGAIGYADCDQLIASKGSLSAPLADFPYEYVNDMKYNGVECRRAKIRNGEYDFWSKQWLYWDHANLNQEQVTTVGQLVAFAKNPANLPLNKMDYWASEGEMWYTKASDASYPTYGGTPIYPLLP
ncbi:MAG: hypothetical protein WBN77_03210 [Desulfobacterales bacterium]